MELHEWEVEEYLNKKVGCSNLNKKVGCSNLNKNVGCSILNKRGTVTKNSVDSW